MKNSRIILFLLFNLIHFTSFSQGEFVIEIDRQTGSYIKTGPAIPDVNWVYPQESTYDENTGTFIFPSAVTNHNLYSIDVSDGSIISNPNLGNVSLFEFDDASNILYGLEIDGINNVKNLVAINPATAAYTQIGNSLLGASLFSGASTFDKINHRYIFLNPPNILYCINATNGDIISNPNLLLAPGENLLHFSFDNSTGILYGLLQDNNGQNCFLVSINTTTGAYTKIGPGTTFGLGGGGGCH